MNRTKLLYRLALAGSALLLLAAAVLAVVPDGVPFQVFALSLGILGALLTGHLRMRLTSTGQRATAAALRTLVSRSEQLVLLEKAVKDVSASARGADETILLALGDTQASIAASESFLLAELSTLRQRITSTATSGSAELLAHEKAVTTRHAWVQGQFQQLRTQLEHLPSDAGEYSTLRRLLVPDHVALPQLGGWAISSSTVDSLVHKALAEDGPRTIVELGSGASTIWLAYALRSRGTGGHIHSLDHLEEYGSKTRALLEAYGLTEFATVHIAPLVPVDIRGRTFNWYDTSALGSEARIDMLLVDGPPAGNTENNRYPALPQLAPMLADGAFVYLDDTIRSDEKHVIELWLSEFPELAQEALLPKSTILRWSTGHH
ncbi:O-methyltransferase [Tessaracoccus antarcticus]|uniref:Class I SAM-dependent methyltransferase n=1 Tax=Tessaracoccus antarcticus TaxID=2479848 RepID=A0A3M0GV83_9ACTN|nr:class I SAM-dependent methyltransferase [Tessaracoccus antarcticus]RMB61236.1 class I SAM-dependent methyltransferase [Tessaracoccus antarcticus]